MDGSNFSVKIPKIDGEVQQGEEQFIIDYKGERKQIRAHDYDEIYNVPGLYEYLFYENYKCKSPNVICNLLKKAVEEKDMVVSDLRVLDVGAGNGIMGEELREAGAESVVGLDIIEAAAEAADRDRPDVYDDYFVEDLTRLPDEVEAKIEAHDPNCMTVVAALGFDDIPPEAFAEAYNMISDAGWIAFNIKDQYLCETDGSGFFRLIDSMKDKGFFEINTQKRYRHRFCQDGTPLYYYAVVGQKRNDISNELLQTCQ